MSARPQTIPKAPPRSVIPPNVEALLRRGVRAALINEQTGVPLATLIRYRQRLGLPTPPRARPHVESLQSAFESRTRPGPDGHLVWTGGTSGGGAPYFMNASTNYSGYRVAFWLRTGTWPVGQARPECGTPHCVAPAHIDDTVTRTRDRAALAAVMGRWHVRTEMCPKGHLYGEWARYKPDGVRYCGGCQADGRKAAPP